MRFELISCLIGFPESSPPGSAHSSCSRTRYHQGLSRRGPPKGTGSHLQWFVGSRGDAVNISYCCLQFSRSMSPCTFTVLNFRHQCLSFPTTLCLSCVYSILSPYLFSLSLSLLSLSIFLSIPPSLSGTCLHPSTSPPPLFHPAESLSSSETSFPLSRDTINTPKPDTDVGFSGYGALGRDPWNS